MERNYYTARSLMLFIVILFIVLFISNHYLFDGFEVTLIPQSTYLMTIVTLCFINAIVCVFMLLYFIVNRQFSIFILSLAFFSGLIYFAEVIILINKTPESIEDVVSIQTTVNDIAIFYFFRQLSLIMLLSIALVVENFNIRVKNGKTIKLFVFILCLVPLVILPVVAHNLSSYNSGYSLTIANYLELPDKSSDKALWSTRYVNTLVMVWSVLFCAIILLNKLSSDIWNGIVVISLSAIIYNLFFHLLSDNLSVWYMSRAMEIFSKVVIASVLIYHILKLMMTSRDISVRDKLTSVFNRKYFFNELGLISENRIHPGFCLLLLEIDNIEHINAKWGYKVGDQVILAIVDIINNNIRHDDLLARLAGKQFGIILYTASVERSTQLAERIRSSVECYTQAGNINNIPEPVTVSIGAFFTSDKNRNASNIYEMACRALYEAKRSGHNQVVLRHSLANNAIR